MIGTSFSYSKFHMLSRLGKGGSFYESEWYFQYTSQNKTQVTGVQDGNSHAIAKPVKVQVETTSSSSSAHYSYVLKETVVVYFSKTNIDVLLKQWDYSSMKRLGYVTIILIFH